VQTLDPSVRAVNEPKRVACGAPDYIVTRSELPVGYIEAKDVGRSLDEIERDEQLKRYRESLSNLILTDYFEFRWYKDGDKQQTARIAYVGDSGRLRPDREGQAQAAAMFSAFLAQEPPIVGKPEDLARRMAALTRIVRDIVHAALLKDRGGSPLREQLDGFRRVLIHDLGEEQFADMYAQTIAYGLFAARVNAPADEHFSRQHAAYDLPKTNPFLRQMFGQIAGPELDDRIAWAVDDLAELLARARMDLVLADFGKRTRQEDPVVHFYETFLKAYDPRMREARGVYYTPEPVVSYIVRGVDHILKTEFGLPDGLADNSMIEVPVPGKPKETRMVHKVQILDPACGTGTFLAQVIETIRDTVVAKHGAGVWPGYVHDHLLPRLYGFELLMAPYAIAHLKLGLRLKETGYDIEQSERLRVYLTNSLEEAHDREHGQLTFFGTWLAEEADRASEVKRELPIMVILGNPPYSGHSVNNGEWVTDLLHGRDAETGESTHSYFEVDGSPLKNTQLKWLSDDYVKFIRFGQWRVERTGHGILSFVTNHSYLDSPTFAGMRRALLAGFDAIDVLDLHGNAKRATVSPDGTADENVFDIQQGVAISIYVKHGADGGGLATVNHHELWGNRSEKYAALDATDCGTTEWMPVQVR
jgi:predicted helicase